MADELIERMTDKWEPAKYKDDYRHAVMELIQKKIESGGEAPAGAVARKRTPTNVIDLVSVLQRACKRPATNPRPPRRPNPHPRRKQHPHKKAA